MYIYVMGTIIIYCYTTVGVEIYEREGVSEQVKLPQALSYLKIWNNTHPRSKPVNCNEAYRILWFSGLS